MDDINPELESFREQWLREVKGGSSADKRPRKTPAAAGASSSKQTSKKAFEPYLPPLAPVSTPKDDGNLEEIEPKAYHDLENKDLAFRLGDGNPSNARRGSTDGLPRSALEHYERAVEKESQGSLGESLSLYRKAFRMDATVDKSYKNKHFPPSSFLQHANPSNAPATVPNPAHHSLASLQPSISQLISEFAGLTIPPAPPATEGTPPPPCPIAALPSEILIEVLLYTAIADVASFARMAQVCKRLAYLVATEERIWKRVCCGSEFGFGAMHYNYACGVLGNPLYDDKGHYLGDASEEVEEDEPTLPPHIEPTPLTDSLLQTNYASSWRHMFHTRPRLRFSGLYISTVNYVRPGAASATQVAWNTPVHIVTYYRYLRFFKDGTVLSLLTVAEPADVIYHLTKENLALHSTGAAGALPSAVVKNALRGRWRLSDPSNASGGERELEPEGDVHIETEGVGEKYIYKIHLSIRSASSAASSRKLRGNKLVWKGFWSYNRLTDDWAEFGLRNDRPFFWSRVRSYRV